MSASPPTSVPHVTTPRLLLREHRMADFEAFAAYFTDPEERPPEHRDRRNAWRTFAAASGQWMLRGAGWWCVEERRTGQVVGTVGAFYRESAFGGEPTVDLELGWAIYRAHRRRGFASEAAAAALAFAFDTLGVRRAIAHIDRDNDASKRVSERIGMRFDREVDFYGTALGRYAIDRA